MEALGFQCLFPVIDWSAIGVAVDGAHWDRRQRKLEGKYRLKERLDREGEKGCNAMGA